MSSRSTTLRFIPLRHRNIRAVSADDPIRLLQMTKTTLTIIGVAFAATIGAAVAFGERAEHATGYAIGCLIVWTLAAVFILRDWLAARLRELGHDDEIRNGMHMQQHNATDQAIDALRRQLELAMRNQQRMLCGFEQLASEMGVDPVELAETRVELARRRVSGTASPAPNSFVPYPTGQLVDLRAASGEDLRPSLDNVRPFRSSKN